MNKLKLREDLTKEQQDFFKNSKIKKNGELVVMYHGTDELFNEFKNRINWFSTSKEYAEQFASWLGKTPYIYEAYLNCKKPFNCGNTNEPVFDLNPTKKGVLSNASQRLINKLGCTEDEFKELATIAIDTNQEEDSTGYKMKLHAVTRLKEFATLVQSKGYDSILTIEQGNVCVGVFNPEDIKRVDNLKPTSSKNIDEDKYNTPTKTFDINDEDATWDKDAEDNFYWSSEADKWAEDYAKAYKVKMSPKDFLNLTTVEGADNLKVGDSVGGIPLRDMNRKEFDKWTNQPIFLEVAFKYESTPNFAQVIGHEGRHRMFALMSIGVKSVDVELYCDVYGTNFNKHKPFDLKYIFLQGQFDKTKVVRVNNPIPLSWKNHKAIRPDLKDEQLDEYFEEIPDRGLDFSDDGFETKENCPVYVTDEVYTIKNILNDHDLPYRILALTNGSYLMQDALGNKTHSDIARYACKQGYVSWDVCAFGNPSYMVYIPKDFNGDLVYPYGIGEDGYYDCRVYDKGVMYVRDTKAYENSLFKALGEPEREITYTRRDGKIVITKDGESKTFDVVKDLSWDPNNALTIDFNPPELRESYNEDEDFPFTLEDICKKYPDLVSSIYQSCGSAFIMPDGRYLLTGKRFDTHVDFPVQVLLDLTDKSYDELMEEWGHDDFNILREFTNHFNLVRINDGTEATEERVYFVTTYTTNATQLNALLTFLDYAFNKGPSVQGYIIGRGKGEYIYKAWNTKACIPDDVIKDIKIGMKYGYFVESLKEDKDLTSESTSDIIISSSEVLNEMKGINTISNPKILKYIEECIEEVKKLEFFSKYDYLYLTYDDIDFKEGETMHTFGQMSMPKYLNGNYTLTLNKHMYEEPEEVIKNTILHELCHYIVMKTAVEKGRFYFKNGIIYVNRREYYDAGDYKGHGRVWKSIAQQVGQATGQDITRTNSYDMHTGVGAHAEEKYKYIFKCKHCGTEFKYAKKTRFVKAVLDGNGHTDKWWCNCNDFTKCHDFEIIKGDN